MSQPGLSTRFLENGQIFLKKMAKWKKYGQTIYFHYLDNIQSIYTEMDPKAFILGGGMALFYRIFDAMSHVLKRSVAFRCVLNSQDDF